MPSQDPRSNFATDKNCFLTSVPKVYAAGGKIPCSTGLRGFVAKLITRKLKQRRFERRISIGSGIFFILKHLNAAKFVFLSVFTVIETICPKIWAKSPSKNEKRPPPADVRRSKTSMLKFTKREGTATKLRETKITALEVRICYKWHSKYRRKQGWTNLKKSETDCFGDFWFFQSSLLLFVMTDINAWEKFCLTQSWDSFSHPQVVSRISLRITTRNSCALTGIKNKMNLTAEIQPFKSVWETAPKSLLWAPISVPRFEYAPWLVHYKSYCQFANQVEGKFETHFR